MIKVEINLKTATADIRIVGDYIEVMKEKQILNALIDKAIKQQIEEMNPEISS
jgi:hypothetical protein